MRKAIAIITLVTFISFQARVVHAWYSIPASAIAATASGPVMVAAAAVTIGGVAIYLSTENGRATATGYYKKVYYSTVQDGLQIWASGYALYSIASMIQSVAANSALSNLKSLYNAAVSYIPTGAQATRPADSGSVMYGLINYYADNQSAYDVAIARQAWVLVQSNHQSANTPRTESCYASGFNLSNNDWSCWVTFYNMYINGSLYSIYDYFLGAKASSLVQPQIDATDFQGRVRDKQANNDQAIQQEIDNTIDNSIKNPPPNLPAPPTINNYPFDPTLPTPVIYGDRNPDINPDVVPLPDIPPFIPPTTIPNSGTTGGTSGTGGSGTNTNTNTNTLGTAANPMSVELTNSSTSAFVPSTAVNFARYGTRVTQFITDLKGTPLFGIIGSFFGSVPTGSYQSSITFNGGRFGTHTFDFSQHYAPFINTLKGLILLIFSFLSIRIVILKR